MILTIKIKHNANFSDYLNKATLVAKFSCENKHFNLTSKDVKHFGLPSAISNQIIRKYSGNKNIREVTSSNVKLTVPSQSIKICDNVIYITPLKLHLKNESKYEIKKINQIELDNIYAYVSFTINENILNHQQDGYIGIDLNATGHCAVVSVPKTGKVIKLGKEMETIHNKYSELRKLFQEQKKFKKLKQLKNKEARKVRDLNHKISRKIVNIADENNLGIKLEKLSGIRENKNNKKSFRRVLHSWPFYQLQLFIEYKAKLLGIPVIYINPAYTSQDCSKCGVRGTRNGKRFVCKNCGHCDHADVNAAFNIALSSNIYQKEKEVFLDGSTDTPIKQFNKKSRKTVVETLEPAML